MMGAIKSVTYVGELDLLCALCVLCGCKNLTTTEHTKGTEEESDQSLLITPVISSLYFLFMILYDRLSC